eukprot:13978229-Alexandrium_andersonii.AAC.1
MAHRAHPAARAPAALFWLTAPVHGDSGLPGAWLSPARAGSLTYTLPPQAGLAFMEGELPCRARAARTCLRGAVGQTAAAPSGEVMHVEGVLRELVEIGDPTQPETEHEANSRDNPITPSVEHPTIQGE